MMIHIIPTHVLRRQARRGSHQINVHRTPVHTSRQTANSSAQKSIYNLIKQRHQSKQRTMMIIMVMMTNVILVLPVFTPPSLLRRKPRPASTAQKLQIRRRIKSERIALRQDMVARASMFGLTDAQKRRKGAPEFKGLVLVNMKAQGIEYPNKVDHAEEFDTRHPQTQLNLPQDDFAFMKDDDNKQQLHSVAQITPSPCYVPDFIRQIEQDRQNILLGSPAPTANVSLPSSSSPSQLQRHTVVNSAQNPSDLRPSDNILDIKNYIPPNYNSSVPDNSANNKCNSAQ